MPIHTPSERAKNQGIVNKDSSVQLKANGRATGSDIGGALSNVLFDFLNVDPSSGRVASQSLQSIADDPTNLGSGTAQATLNARNNPAREAPQPNIINNIETSQQVPSTTNQPLQRNIIQQPPNIQEQDIQQAFVGSSNIDDIIRAELAQVFNKDNIINPLNIPIPQETTQQQTILPDTSVPINGLVSLSDNISTLGKPLSTEGRQIALQQQEKIDNNQPIPSASFSLEDLMAFISNPNLTPFGKVF